MCFLFLLCLLFDSLLCRCRGMVFGPRLLVRNVVGFDDEKLRPILIQNPSEYNYYDNVELNDTFKPKSREIMDPIENESYMIIPGVVREVNSASENEDYGSGFTNFPRGNDLGQLYAFIPNYENCQLIQLEPDDSTKSDLNSSKAHHNRIFGECNSSYNSLIGNDHEKPPLSSIKSDIIKILMKMNPKLREVSSQLFEYLNLDKLEKDLKLSKIDLHRKDDKQDEVHHNDVDNPYNEVHTDKNHEIVTNAFLPEPAHDGIKYYKNYETVYYDDVDYPYTEVCADKNEGVITDTFLLPESADNRTKYDKQYGANYYGDVYSSYYEVTDKNDEIIDTKRFLLPDPGNGRNLPKRSMRASTPLKKIIKRKYFNLKRYKNYIRRSKFEVKDIKKPPAEDEEL